MNLFFLIVSIFGLDCGNMIVENSLDELYEKLKSDNETIVLGAMRAIGNLHSSTPMQGLKDASKYYEDDIDKLLEDF